MGIETEYDNVGKTVLRFPECAYLSLITVFTRNIETGGLGSHDDEKDFFGTGGFKGM